MKKHCQTVQKFAMLFILFGVPEILAEKPTEPVAQKDGINLYLWAADPLGVENSEILCELENTTDKNVAFERRGNADKFPFVLHLLDIEGKEIEKTKEWMTAWETGFQIHTRFGMIPTGEIVDRHTFDLREAYGDKWTQGVRLKVIWNPGGVRKGPGPFAGVFGVGDGLEASIDVSRGRAKKAFDPLPSETRSKVQDKQDAEEGQGTVLKDKEAEVATIHRQGVHGKKWQVWVGIVTGGAFLLVAVLLFFRRGSKSFRQG